MAFTYAQLKTAIQDYTDNTETSFVTNLPVFIRLAEEKILKEVQLTVFRKNSEGTMTQNNKYLTVPSDYLTPFSLTYITSGGAQNFLLLKMWILSKLIHQMKQLQESQDILHNLMTMLLLWLPLQQKTI